MFDFRQSIFDADGEYGEDLVHCYIDGLTAEFDASDEARRLPPNRTNWVHPFLSFGFNYIGVSPADMTLRDFEEVLFELFPRKVSTDAEEAESIVVELRAFWTFVARQYAASNAATILRVLDDAAVDRLHRALSNPANFGMAKSLVAMGARQGFDMTSDAGLAAFVAAYNANLQIGSQASLPTQRPKADSQKEKRKAKRKQRQAKKRNRPR